MKTNINILKNKRKAVIEHQKLIEYKQKRKQHIAAETKIAKENPELYKKGTNWIKTILEFRKNHRKQYFLNIQITKLLKKYPELYTKDVLKSIFVASINPNLDIQKIDQMVNDFDKLTKNQKTDILKNSLVKITKENYGYLLY